MASSRKRKPRPGHSTSHNRSNAANIFQNDLGQAEQARGLDPSLFIQAYEADIIRGPRASQAAASLEVFDYGTDSNLPVTKIGDGLIQWGGNHLRNPPAFPGDEDEVIDSSEQTAKIQTDGDGRNGENGAVWVDRYDARLLLDELIPLRSRATDTTRSVPDSPGGWSDIPSDSEDAFFFSPEEAEDFRREKKRRLLDRNREERLQARRIEDGESSEVEDEEEIWGGSDEEPDESQREIMRRTAQHLLSSPNPAQLEMRILANHGGDRKFAFLRGRWSRTWMILKGKARREKDDNEREEKKESGLGVLAGYGDSEDDSDNDNPRDADDTNRDRDIQGATEEANPKDDDDAKMARRARAKEWAKKRRA